MSPCASSLAARRQRGSAFITVIIFTTLMMVLAASIIGWSTSERRLNTHNAKWLEARNAAEAVAEYGFSQVRNQFNSQASPPSFNPAGSNPLVLPPVSFFANSNVDTNTNMSTDTHSLQLVGGTVQDVPTSGALYFIDPSNPANSMDPLKGEWVFRRDIAVMASATSAPPNAAPLTAYVTEKVSVRGAPLFAHAIFYANNDLELFPGPQMDIYGPVHCNGNIFISDQSSSVGLSFHGPVTCTQNLFHAWSNTNSAAEGSGGETLGQNPVNFVNSAGALVNLNTTGTSTGWKDSTMGTDSGISGSTTLSNLVTSTQSILFRQYASETYNGNLQTGSMGVETYNPVAFTQAIDAAGDTPSPHALIDPPATTAYLTDSSQTAQVLANRAQVEQQKMANQAGLYILVTVNPLSVTDSATTATLNVLTTTNSTPSTATNSAATIAFYGPAGSAAAAGVTNPALIGPNGGLLLNPPSDLANAATNTTSPPLITYMPFRRVQTTVTKSGSVLTASFTVLNAANAVVGSLPTTSVSGASSTASTGTTYSIYPMSATGATSVATNGAASISTTGSSLTTTYGSGMYDQRRGLSTVTTTTSTLTATQEIGATDLVQVDVKSLANAVNAMINGTSGAVSASSAITQSVSGTSSVWGANGSQWNGGVYIDVEAPSAVAGTSSQSTSVRLVDAQVASGSSLIPANAPNDGNTNAGSGLSIATNAPVYILGNFNADGSLSSSSPSTPDDGGLGTTASPTKESPVCVAGDAITILSPAWQDTKSLALDPSTSTNVEVAAALLTGLVATSNGSSSGGAHNLPRFLESWGATVDIRGALVTMYSSKVATQPWSTAYYGAPTRAWGFDTIFANGTYPPLTPKVMSYRRVDFGALSQATYSSTLHQLWPSSF